ncbi:uncharacterized protein LOC111293287 [Durio zibethinus]|uniref:Uncharacterized protein LOC111293287 n=1 Tax=Durio zibethinus TaxID=66656 RepID=A0A6P5YNB9_DURZI|nr:uncharacterized protein LOC111293287 [Durio zibethinus]
MDGSPWSFDKHLLVMQDYSGLLKADEYNFDVATFWVRIYSLPLGMMNGNMVERLGNRIGVVVVNKGEGRADIWARLAYERQPTFCYNCKLLEHGESECDTDEADHDNKGRMKQYGEWL